VARREQIAECRAAVTAGSSGLYQACSYLRHHIGEIAMVTCPVCKSEAEEIEPGTFDGVWFRCLKHREFGVSDTALKTRKDAEPEQWERALKKAFERAGAEKRPKITDDDFR
jgi:hypothetical protein